MILLRNSKFLLTVLGCAVTLLFLLILNAYRIADNLKVSFDDVERTYEIIAGLESIKADLNKVSSSSKAIQLSGRVDSTYFNDIQESFLAINNSSFKIMDLATDPEIKNKILLLVENIELREQQVKQRIEQVADKNSYSVAPYEQILASRQISTSLDSIINDIKSDEKDLLTSRKARTESHFQYTIGSLVMVGFLSLILGFLAIGSFKSDIRKRLSVENELREINENKNKFFTIISHDLKGPLRGIIALTDFLYNGKNVDTEQQRNITYHLHVSAQNLYKLAENLLNWSRLQMNKIELEPAIFDIRSAVNEIIEQTGFLAVEKKIQIINNCDANCMVYADKNMIITVFRNLISNAIKFSHNDSKIFIDMKQKNDLLEVSVKDSGVGIGPEGLKKIFKVGTNYSSAGTKGEKGTGLGLIITKEFIEKNNGSIWVESTKNSGTTFYFTIPLAKYGAYNQV